TLISAPAAFAQVTGSIAGIVRDASGAVLPGATVTVRGAALRRESVSTTTSPEGTYRVALVPPGAYDVSVELTGFSAQTRRKVEVVIYASRSGCRSDGMPRASWWGPLTYSTATTGADCRPYS